MENDASVIRITLRSCDRPSQHVRNAGGMHGHDLRHRRQRPHRQQFQHADHGGGDENFRPGLGRDTIQGGLGYDVVRYDEATTRVFVDFVRGFAIDHGGSRDGLDSVEDARGGSGNDVLRGGLDHGFLRGNQGADTLISGYSTTSPNVCGAGVDYNSDPAGVTVNLLEGFAIDGWGTRDTIIGQYWQARGSAFNDSLIGNNLNNALRPGRGVDGVQISVVLDCGVGAVDWRGGWFKPGA